MAIFINEKTRVLVQGITGKQGSFHARQMQEFGTQIAAGVAPGAAGATVADVPVYPTVAAACRDHELDASVLFVPAPFARDAALEALAAGIRLVVIISEHIPVHDAMQILAYANAQGATIIGPNTFGIAAPGKAKLGIAPNQIFAPGPVGVVARSGTLTYELVANLRDAGHGASAVVGLGGDRVAGQSFVDVLAKLEEDPETEAILMVGEIGGSAEEEAAEFIKGHVRKPVLAYLAGKSAPPGKRMGHAGAIIERGRGSFAGKVKALNAAGVAVAELPSQVPDLVQTLLTR
ncbi:MAG: succinate--CoA ligase subunit alpha [Firmicutes bacterium]|nr:succinate--CoA ligase subunit alpha [Bacillota bacterium]